MKNYNCEVTVNSKTARRTLHFYWQVIKVQKTTFFMSIISTALFSLLITYMNPFIIGKIVDEVSVNPPKADEVFSTFGIYIAVLVLINVAGQAFSKLQDYFLVKTQIRGNYELSALAFNTLSNQSMTFHTSRFGGSLVSQTLKFLAGFNILVEAFVYALMPIMCAAIYTSVLLAPTIPLYVLFLWGLLIFYIAAAYLLFKKILPINAQAAAAQNTLSGQLSDSILNILAVKTSGKEKYEKEKFEHATAEVRRVDSKRMRATLIRGAILSFITVLIMVTLAIFAAGGNAWFGISAGTIVMMFTYTYSLSMQFNRLSQVMQQINRSFGEAHDMTLILDEATLVKDEENAPDFIYKAGDIEIEDLSFSHIDKSNSTCVFKNFSLHVPAGQKLGLVGRSGAGKTTLTTILLRLADVSEGRVLIDGQDISKVNQSSLRRQVAYVAQEPMLFHRSIRENIAYGRPEATNEEIEEAAAKACAMEFISKLPDGLDTLTGERGVKLSGGQRQRIAIARAILSDAPILILDEATSALDSQSEKLIQEALGNLMHGRTSIVIAHRLSTVSSLDRIVVLHDGKIVEDGTHDSLANAGGEYEQLWMRQSGAFLGH